MALFITNLELPNKDNEVIIRIKPDGTVLNIVGIHLNAHATQINTYETNNEVKNGKH